MEFVNPALLAGAALAAIPIVLHLIMRQQPKLLEFPALRFLKARQQANRRKMKLRHLLLLAMRVAAICLLALALARPSIRASGMLGDQESPTAAALVFDTSPRMGYRQDNQTRLEGAREIAQWLVKQFPPDSQVAIVDPSSPESTFQIDTSTARQRIERLEPSGLGRPLPELIESATRLLKESDLPRKEIYVFTDFTQPSWTVDSPQRLQEELKSLPSVALYVVDVGAVEPRNLSLGEIQLSAQFLARNGTLRVVTSLDSLGVDAERTIEMYLSDSHGKMQKRSEESVTVAADGTQTVDFAIGGLDIGTHQGFVRIVGEDALAIDDARYFTVEVNPPWRVLIAANSPAEAQAANFTEAIAPSEFRRNRQARFDCTVISFDELAAQPLEKFAAVCLLDPPALDEGAWRRLSDYARSGGGVGLFLGSSAQIATLNAAAAQELLPGTLGFQARYPDGSAYLTTRDAAHPMLALFRARRGNVPWEDFPVYRFWQFDELHDGVAVVVAYINGRPALLEKPLGKGRVLTLTTPISELAEVRDLDRWNELWGVGSWPFFTLTNEMMLYLVGGSDSQLNYQAGQAAVLQLDAGSRHPTYLVSTPDGQSLRQAPNQDQAIVITATQTPGNYRIRAGGESGGVDRGFSVNLSPDASRLERIDEARLTEVFGDVPFRTAKNQEQIDRDVSLDRVGREMYPLLIAVVAIVLGLEHLLANRFYQQAPPATEQP